MWFSSRLQPWLRRRRIWRGWSPQKRRGRTWRQTSHPLRAGSSFCARPCPGPLPTPGLCLSACTVSSPKRISDLQVPFHQIPPSSNPSRVPSFVASQTVLTPSVGRRLCQSEPERPWRGPVQFGDQESYQHLRDFPLGSLGSCGGRGMGFSYWKISFPKRWPLLFGGWGGPEQQQEVCVLPPAGLCSFLLFRDYPLGYCPAFIVSVNTYYIY